MSDGENIRIPQGCCAEPLGDGYCIIQRKDGYRFGSDAVALAHFAEPFVKRTDTVADLCSGCGIIGIMLAVSTGATVVGAEIDADMAETARLSAALDKLDKVTFFNTDIRDADSDFASAYANAINVVVCNPPFYKAGSKPKTIAPQASAELSVTFDDVARSAARLLAGCGMFMLVHTCSRLDEVLGTCARHGLTPKDLTVNVNGKTFLLRCVKGGKSGMTVRVSDF